MLKKFAAVHIHGTTLDGVMKLRCKLLAFTLYHTTKVTIAK